LNCLLAKFHEISLLLEHNKKKTRGESATINKISPEKIDKSFCLKKCYVKQQNKTYRKCYIFLSTHLCQQKCNPDPVQYLPYSFILTKKEQSGIL
jgi:hypothetical protein